MKSHIVLESHDVVKVCFDHSTCDVFLTADKLPVSDIELIEMVRKYQNLVRRRCR